MSPVCAAPPKIDYVRSLGADQVIDTRQNFADGTSRYDLTIDIAGNTSLARLRRALTPTGTLVIVGGEEGGKWTGGFGRSLRAPLLSPFVPQRRAILGSQERASDQQRLTPLIEAGQVTPRSGGRSSSPCDFGHPRTGADPRPDARCALHGLRVVAPGAISFR
jgi:NADPH:quinone reductase-like Zn-dependent oxidoreductase